MEEAWDAFEDISSSSSDEDAVLPHARAEPIPLEHLQNIGLGVPFKTSPSYPLPASLSA